MCEEAGKSKRLHIAAGVVIIFGKIFCSPSHGEVTEKSQVRGQSDEDLVHIEDHVAFSSSLQAVDLQPLESLPVVDITFYISGCGVELSEYAKFAGEASLDVLKVSNVANVGWTPQYTSIFHFADYQGFKEDQHGDGCSRPECSEGPS